MLLKSAKWPVVGPSSGKNNWAWNMPCSLSLVSAVMLDVVFSMPQNIMLQGPSVGNINIALTTNKSIASISFIKIESHAYFESHTLLSNHFQNVEYIYKILEMNSKKCTTFKIRVWLHLNQRNTCNIFASTSKRLYLY